MMRLIEEVVPRVPEFGKVGTDRLLVSAAFNRRRRRSGVLAYVLPLKYQGGSPVETRSEGDRTYHWAMLPTFHGDVEILYMVYFMLPRFLNLPFREKLETVIHELYHIHPDFNGDLRRFRGRNPTHGCQEQFDRRVRAMTDAFLASDHNPQAYEFLRHSYFGAEKEYGEVVARQVKAPRPKLLKVSGDVAHPYLEHR